MTSTEATRLAELHAKATRTPWKAKKRNWRNEPDPHNVYISGDAYEDDDFCEDGTDVTMRVSTAVAIVCGNATSGTIADDTAAYLVAAANAVPELLRERERLLTALETAIAIVRNEAVSTRPWTIQDRLMRWAAELEEESGLGQLLKESDA